MPRHQPPTFPCRAETLIDLAAAERPDHVAIPYGTRIEFRDNLPRSPLGKVLRNRL